MSLTMLAIASLISLVSWIVGVPVMLAGTRTDVRSEITWSRYSHAA